MHLSTSLFGMLLLSIITSLLCIWDVTNPDEAHGVGIVILAVEICVAIVWLGGLVLRGMGLLA